MHKYQYIQLSAIPTELDHVLDANSEYNVGVRQEKMLASSAHDLLNALSRCVSLMAGHEAGVTYKQTTIDAAVKSARELIDRIEKQA